MRSVFHVLCLHSGSFLMGISRTKLPLWAQCWKETCFILWCCFLLLTDPSATQRTDMDMFVTLLEKAGLPYSFLRWRLRGLLEQPVGKGNIEPKLVFLLNELSTVFFLYPLPPRSRESQTDTGNANQGKIATKEFWYKGKYSNSWS